MHASDNYISDEVEYTRYYFLVIEVEGVYHAMD